MPPSTNCSPPSARPCGRQVLAGGSWPGVRGWRRDLLVIDAVHPGQRAAIALCRIDEEGQAVGAGPPHRDHPVPLCAWKRLPWDEVPDTPPTARLPGQNATAFRLRRSTRAKSRSGSAGVGTTLPPVSCSAAATELTSAIGPSGSEDLGPWQAKRRPGHDCRHPGRRPAPRPRSAGHPARGAQGHGRSGTVYPLGLHPHLAAEPGRDPGDVAGLRPRPDRAFITGPKRPTRQ